MQSMRNTKAAANNVIKDKNISTIANTVNSFETKNVVIEFHRSTICKTQAELHKMVNESAEITVGPRNLRCDHGGSQFG